MSASYVTGRDTFAQDFLDALGIKDKNVTQVSVFVPAGDLCTVTVTRLVDKEQATRVYALLQKHQAELYKDDQDASNHTK